MTAPEIIEKSATLLGIAKTLLKAAYAIGAGIVVISVWVYSTNRDIVAANHDISAVQLTVQAHATADLVENKENELWHTNTDKTLSRLTTILENQQVVLMRHQAQLDNLHQPISYPPKQ